MPPILLMRSSNKMRAFKDFKISDLIVVSFGGKPPHHPERTGSLPIEMQLFMTKIPYAVDAIDLTRQLRSIFHDTSPFTEIDSRGEYASPMNFNVFLFPDKRSRRNPHSGSGVLTLPTQQLANMAFSYFLANPLRMDGQAILVRHSNKDPRSDVLEEIRLLPYRDPQVLAESRNRLQAFSCDIRLDKVQFLWMCRDWVLSPEWDWSEGPEGWTSECSPEWDSNEDPGGSEFEYSPEWDWSEDFEGGEFEYFLRFLGETRQLVLVKRVESDGEWGLSPGELSIRMRYSHITSIDIDNECNILFHLSCPPSFEWEEPDKMEDIMAEMYGLITYVPPRQKLPISKDSRIPFVWSIVRARCEDKQQLDLFVQLAEMVNFTVLERTYLIETRNRFDKHTQNIIQSWFKTLNWKAAFQCEMLYRNQLVDAKELLDIHQDITELNNSRGLDFTVDIIKQLSIRLRRQWERNDEDGNDTVRQELQNAIVDIETNNGEPPTRHSGRRLFLCYHATISPAGTTLSGPFPDVSNRVIRQYIDNQDSFLRVSFTDENGLRFEFDNKEIDGAKYLEDHVGGILIKGFELGGRHFEFLGYSQSALKQHTVWFVSPFSHNGERIDSQTIRDSIGSHWSAELRRRPALYAARLSQAFTATNPTVTVNHGEIKYIRDIERNGHCFSDGNGSVSQELADEIHRALAGQRRRARVSTPSVFQIRIQGSKGVISIDPTLVGRKLLLRDSMKKFEAVHHHEIEIARSFDQPVKFYLNRPLIMILSGLEVPNDAFLDLQHAAVQQTNDAVKTAKGAYTLLESYGLGSSFTLPSTIISLENLGIPFQKQPDVDNSGIKDSFMDRSLQCAVHHVLREIKFKCRIPVPKCWKLVGIVDVYNELAENEIYAKVVENYGSDPIYLEGEVMISKSPTIHPGDVQIVYAIGRPPSTSHLGKLRNCVVFSQRGARPLPNQLSGSDLDGDEYDLVPLKSLRPPRTVNPGAYTPVGRLTLDRECTIEDIAQFVVKYMTNDTLGIIATRFLHIADTRGIFYRDCALLAELHSRAVDFPKNGVPVPFRAIPTAPRRVKPDWSAPEIITKSNEAYYYTSKSILGVLFRDVKLPEFDLQPQASKKRRRRRVRRDEEGELLEELMENLSLESIIPKDVISLALHRKLDQSIDLVSEPDLDVAISNLFAEFSSGLEQIAYAYSLSRNFYKRLSEEEILVGTIIAKTSQPRKRQDTISSMREATTELVQRILKDLEGDGNIEDWANRAWTAWKVSLINTSNGVFGAKCFGFVALRALLEGCVDGVREKIKSKLRGRTWRDAYCWSLGEAFSSEDLSNLGAQFCLSPVVHKRYVSESLDYTQDASTLLRFGTMAAHERAEKSSGAIMLTNGNLPKEEYVRFLVILWHIYSVLETTLDAHSSNPIISPTYNPRILSRTSALSADIAYFLQTSESDWKSHPLIASLYQDPPVEVKDYMASIKSAASSDDLSRLLAHAYVRYLGDLSGGQVIKRRIRKSYNLEDEQSLGTQFYDFEKLDGREPANIGDMRTIKMWFRDGLNESVGDNQDRKVKLVNEANLAFRLNEGILGILREGNDLKKASTSKPYENLLSITSFLLVALTVGALHFGLQRIGW
ncbi:hypothetical protein Clacol_010056 [Clathrus columnatus]|uniref:RDRP core domain-containing protein n=1 Tax=Clathrus columnatus TaxID=1419009 RepID=A0AAV5AT19_9AGAM|nr:hypothetical protein Clacol_010056 [Clathrus columnatus]